MKHNWEYRKFGELCDILRGGSPRPIQNYLTEDDNGLNWIKIGDVAVGAKYITSTKEKIKPEGLKKTRQVHKGDFILSNSMSFGRPYILKIDGCIHDGWLAIQGVEEYYIPDFLFYFLSSPSTYCIFEKSVKGGVVSNLNTDIVKAISMPVPPMETQERIVTELDEINGMIDAKREQLKQLDLLAQSIFYTMFGDPVTNPKGWEVKKMGDPFEIGSGGTPSKEIDDYWNSNDIPWIGSNMCQNRVLYQTDGKYISHLGLENSSAKVLDNGTVLIALVGATIGKVAILQTHTATNQNVGFIKPNKDVAIPMFVFYEIQALYELFSGFGNGKFRMANLTFIRNLPLILPPLRLQEQFAAKVESIESRKANIEATVKELQILLDSRMDYWFN
ncbi:MAG: restriction endonuclease subunit S [Muribaculum sp.]|nr:restriction endonuclease subunit S [Muribaculum sp.]